MKKLYLLTAVAAAALLAACGGGDSAPPSSLKTTAVKVVGDSLNDSGTFGFKFTVQTPPQTLIWTDRVASGVGAPTLCARYGATSVDGSTIALNPIAASCTSYAVGGARVNPAGTARDATGFSVVQQLKDLAAAGNYGSEELLLVDGGGNDVGDLLEAYLAAGQDSALSYRNLLLELLSPAAVQTALTRGPQGFVDAGVQYMAALANVLADAVTAQALGKGAQRVAVINAPDVTRTPRFTLVLAGITQQFGAAAAADIQVVARAWVGAFNTQLAARFTGNPRVIVVDFNGEFNRWLDQPSQYGLTNTTTPACPVVGSDNGLPKYALDACTANVLPNGWQTYVFSDNFHGTPKTNELFAQLVLDALRAKGLR